MELVIIILILIAAANILRPPVRPAAPLIVTIEPQPEDSGGAGAILLAVLALIVLFSLLAA